MGALPPTNREQQKIDENQDQSDFESENVQDSDEPFLVVKKKKTNTNKKEDGEGSPYNVGRYQVTFLITLPEHQVDKLTHSEGIATNIGHFRFRHWP